MQLDKMIELYATGDWILISKMQLCNWHKTSTFNLQENHYELIHKKHYDVLDHMLNGGKCIGTNTDGFSIEFELGDFVKWYNQENTYEIIKDNPEVEHGTDEMLLEDLSLNELKEITAKHEKVAADKYRKDKPVGRITREDLEIIASSETCDKEQRLRVARKTSNYIEYLEANQKEK